MLFSIPDDHGFVYGIILYGIGAILIAMFIRMIASWVRLDDRYAFIRFLYKLTDPFIMPFRGWIPALGIFDFSFILGFFLLLTLQILLTQALPTGW